MSNQIDIEKSKVARDWKKIVEANAELNFVPEEFIGRAKEWNDLRNNLRAYVDAAAKMELTTLHALNTMMFSIREYYEKAGIKDIWKKDMGFQTEALKEGIFILEISDQKPGAR